MTLSILIQLAGAVGTVMFVLRYWVIGVWNDEDL